MKNVLLPIPNQSRLIEFLEQAAEDPGRLNSETVRKNFKRASKKAIVIPRNSQN